MLLKWSGNSRADEDTARADASTSAVAAQGPWRLILLLGTLAWFALCVFYIARHVGFASFGFMLPHEVALVVLAMMAPPVFGWLVLLVYQRGGDVARSRAALLEVLSDVSGPNTEAEARLNASAMALRRISQTVEAELANAVARADDLSSRIGTGTEQLGLLAQGASERSAEINQLLQQSQGQQHELLRELRILGEKTSDLSRSDADALGGAVDNATRKVNEIGAELTNRAKAMAETVDIVARRAAQIGAVIDQPINRLREESDQTVRRLAASSQELKARVESLSQEMARTSDQAGEASRGVDDSAQRLRTAGNDIRAILNGAGQNVAAQAEQLRGLVSGAVKASDQAAQRLDGRLEKLAASLDHMNVGAGEAEESLLSIADRLNQTVERFGEQAAQTGEVASDAVEKTDAASAALMAAGSAIGATSRQVLSANQQLLQVRDDINATVTHLDGVVAESMDTLQERLREATSFAEAAAERSGEKLSRVGIDMTDMGRRIEKQVVLLEQQARQSEAQGSGAADMIALRLGELTGALAELDAQSKTSQSGLQQLRDAGIEVTSGLRTTLSDLDSAIGHISERSAHVSEDVTGAVSRLQTTASAVEGRLGLLGDNVAGQIELFEQLGQRLAQTTAQAERDTAARLQAIAARIEDVAAATDTQLGQMSENMDQTFSGFEARARTLHDNAAAASQASLGATATLSEASAELSLILNDFQTGIGASRTDLTALEDRIREIGASVRSSVDDSMAVMDERSGALTARLLEGAGELSAAAEEVERRGDFSFDRLEQARARCIGQISDMETELDALTAAWLDRTGQFEGMSRKLSAFEAQVGGETAERLQGLAAYLSDAATAARSAISELEGQKNGLSAAGEEVSTRLSGAVAEMELRLSSLNAESSRTVEAVAAQTEALSHQMQTLAQTGTESGDLLAAEQSRVGALVDGLKLAVGSLDTDVRNLAASAGNVIGELGDQGDSLRETTQAQIAALAENASTLSQEGARIQAVLLAAREETDAADQSLRQAAQGLSERVKDATSLAQVTADTLLASSGALTEEAAAAQSGISEAAARIRQEVSAIQDLGSEAAEKLSGAAGEIELQSGSLRAASKVSETEALARAEQIAERMNQLTAQDRQIRADFEANAQSVVQSAELSEARSRAAVAALQEVTTMIEAGLPTANAAEASANALREAGRELMLSIDRAELRSREAVVRLTEERQEFAEENARLNTSLANGLARFNATLDEAKSRVTAFATAEEAAAEVTEANTANLEAQLARTAEIAELLQVRGTEMDTLLAARIDAVSKAEAVASATARALSEKFAAEEARLKAMRDDTASDTEGFVAQVSSGLADLKAQSDLFTQQLQDLDRASDALRASMAESASGIQEQVSASTAANEQLKTLASESVTAVEQQRTALEESVRQSESATTHAVQAMAEQLAGILESSTSRVAERQENLGESVRQSGETVASAADTLAGKLSDMEAGAARMLEEQREAFAQAIRESEAAAASATDRLGAQLNAITETSTQSLEQQRASFGESIKQAEDAAAHAKRTLGEQATAIASASQAATMQSGLAARAFESQAIRLEASARQAAEIAEQLNQTSQGNSRKRFLTSAAMVAEGLNSLALDLHRDLDSDETERQFRRFQKGDRGLFTRRLVNRGDRREIAAAYREDGDFRRHVDTYLTEFESMLKAVNTTDRDDMLLGVFLSADIGKLYMALCDALDRKPDLS